MARTTAEASRKIRIGGVGVGRGEGVWGLAGKDHRVSLVAVCDLDVEAHDRRGLSARNPSIEKLYTDFDKFLEHDMDAVMICTPPHCHAPQSIAALGAGLHVWSEIPIASTVEESKALVRAVRKTRKIYMSGENVCYDGMTDTWRQLVRDGRIGKPFYAEGEYMHDLRPIFPRRWHDKVFPEAPMGGPDTLTWRAHYYPIRYCTHEMGPLLKILDDRVTSVMCVDTGSNVSPETGTIDMAVAMMKTANGCLIKEMVGFSLAQAEGFHYYCIYGTKGCLETERWGDGKTLAYFDDVPNLKSMMRLPLASAPRKIYPGYVTAGGHGGCDGAMVLDFIDALAKGRPSPIDVYQGLDFTLPGILGVDSVKKGSVWLPVPDPRKW
jgi:predicted dehydrogenase